MPRCVGFRRPRGPTGFRPPRELDGGRAGVCSWLRLSLDGTGAKVAGTGFQHFPEGLQRRVRARSRHLMSSAPSLSRSFPFSTCVPCLPLCVRLPHASHRPLGGVAEPCFERTTGSLGRPLLRVVVVDPLNRQANASHQMLWRPTVLRFGNSEQGHHGVLRSRISDLSTEAPGAPHRGWLGESVVLTVRPGVVAVEMGDVECRV